MLLEHFRPGAVTAMVLCLGSLFVFQRPHRADLVSFPSRAELARVLAPANTPQLQAPQSLRHLRRYC